MKYLVFTITLVLMVYGCASRKPTIDTKTITTDSITTTISYEKQLDTFNIKADSLKISIPLKKLSETPVLVKSQNGRVRASVSKIDNNIEVECHIDKLLKIVESQNKTIETFVKHIKNTDTTVTKVEYRTPWLSRVLAGLGAVFIVVLLLRINNPFKTF